MGFTLTKKKKIRNPNKENPKNKQKGLILPILEVEVLYIAPKIQIPKKFEEKISLCK